MIAVVSSTIKPRIIAGKNISRYSFEDRLEQTRLTLTRLNAHGFTDIFLADNSPDLDQQQLESLLHGFQNLKAYHIRQHQFENKGINELLMLLYLTEVIPAGREIFKISGRYYPAGGFQKPDFEDFAVRWYHPGSRKGAVSTRGYWAKDAQTLQLFLLRCQTELSVYSYRAGWIRSLVKRVFSKNPDPLNISIEFAAANVFKLYRYKVKQLDHIGIEGLVAGVNHYEKLKE